MLAALAMAGLCQAPVIQPPRLRTILANGSVVLVERRPVAKELCVDLFVSSKSAPDTRASYGLRHLMEHLTARGPDGTLDVSLESHGAFLTADTTREAIEYDMVLRPGDLGLALQTVLKLLDLGPVTRKEIKHEAAIIGQEVALEPPTELLSKAAWSAAYGPAGLDPVGDPAIIATATPEELSALHKALFTGPNLALVIVGDVDLDSATAAAKATLASAPATGQGSAPILRGLEGSTSAPVTGEVKAVPVGPYDELNTAAALAAAFGAASQLKEPFVTYTPSAGSGLVILGTTDRSSGLQSKLGEINAASVFALGRALATRYISEQLRSESGAAHLRGLLLVQGAGLRPELMLQSLNQMTFADFSRALQRFKSEQAVTVNGS